MPWHIRDREQDLVGSPRKDPHLLITVGEAALLEHLEKDAVLTDGLNLQRVFAGDDYPAVVIR